MSVHFLHTNVKPMIIICVDRSGGSFAGHCLMLSDRALMRYWISSTQSLCPGLSPHLCWEGGSVQVQVYSSSYFCPHCYAPHICTSEPLSVVLGLDFTRNPPIISSANSHFLLWSILHSVKKLIASLPCSEIFSHPALLRVCNFSFTA